ncbi:MAG: hypothetical protein NT072_09230, partial [Deltaproteobacteria bacterium]|nr:hypothetical protein [Deltaproteobacteria bacterium]
LVEVTPWFVKLDGERERIAGNPKTRGQVIVLDRRQGGLEGLRGWSYDGHLVDLSGGVQKAEITTRDIDRDHYPHFLLKEILEAPLSIQKTMRGKYTLVRDAKGKTGVTFNLGDEIIPRRLRKALEKRTLTRIFVIGQGTAAVAGAAIAEALSKYLKGHCRHPVGNHHRHEPGRGHGQGAGRPPCGNREQAPVRHHPCGPRGILHERRP